MRLEAIKIRRFNNVPQQIQNILTLYNQICCMILVFVPNNINKLKRSKTEKLF